VLSIGQAVAPAALRGEEPRPGETPLTGGYPWYDVYEAADGYVTLAALEPEFWRAFCEAVDRPEWRDRHGTDDPAERAALREGIADLFAGRTRDEWLAVFDGVDAAVGGVFTPGEAVEHPQFEARGIVRRDGSAGPRVGAPMAGPDVDEAVGSPPAHGADTDDLLGSVGYTDAELSALRERGVIR
jgi:crotonobetainyl-CoA:carnitine CoA-transferase CaiB-like acyl-CoA transferase